MSEKNIYQRLHAAMQTVKYVQKGTKQVNGQYTFVGHDAVVAVVRPALLDNGIVLSVSVISHAQDGNRTEARVRLSFVNIDKPDDRIDVEAFGYGIDPQDKGPGKAVSYATKYGLLKTLCLETGDDPERDSIPHETERTRKETMLRQAVENALELNEKGDEEGAWGELYDIAMGDDNDAKMFIWSLLPGPDKKGSSTPNTRLRSMLKKRADAERAAIAARANPVASARPLTPAEELATQP